MQLPRPPIIVGGTGPRRTPGLASRFADEFNVPFRNVESSLGQLDLVRAASLARGRTAPIFSVAQTVAVGRSDADVRRRLEATGYSREEMAAGQGVCGTVDESVEWLSRWAEIGVERTYCQLLDITDIDQLEVLASQVLPQL
jgi:alkanesulfonate monooxygenase SsuD/methylene tetrahydromethanopterin reductase-like flavin-dependent oxidoreductase (luciferase family)